MLYKAIEAWLSLVERCVRDAEVVGSNPVASTTWQGQPEMPYLSAFPVLFLRVSNEPCVDRMAGGCRELAHGQTYGRLDTYGERRDSHELRSSEVTCRHGSLRHKVTCRHGSLCHIGELCIDRLVGMDIYCETSGARFHFWCCRSPGMGVWAQTKIFRKCSP